MHRRVNYAKYLFFAVVAWVVLIFYFALHFDVKITESESGVNRLKLVRLNVHGGDNMHRPDSREIPPVFQVQAPEEHKDSALLGEMGEPVNIDKDKLNAHERAEYEKGWKENAFNAYASNQISLRRSLPDLRDKRCLSKQYQNLPTASVIVIFHQEALSTLLRTVHSVINRSSPHLLREVILVDDNSTMAHLGAPLENYIQKNFPWPKVKLLRMTSRVGLIQARVHGALKAKGEVLIFLDSHCEATIGWLEPLLGPISKDRRTVVVPIIEGISDTTLAISGTKVDNVQIGGFDWGLIFRWFPPGPERVKARASSIDPLETPTMAGGLFAIDKSWFTELGMYDPGMKIWGGENLELSFKTWMCGGRLVTAMCSHVGHIFRKRSPYSWGPEKNVLTHNLARLALVWLDDYKQFYLERVPSSLITPELYGDISEQLKLRERLKCNNFSWYHHNVYKEMFVPSESKARGEVRNMGADYCLDSPAKNSGDLVIGYRCHHLKGNQMWYLSKTGQIRRDLMCIQYRPSNKPGLKKAVKVNRCSMSSTIVQHETWNFTDGFIKNQNGLCLELLPNNEDLTMSVCNDDNLRQQWSWNND